MCHPQTSALSPQALHPPEVEKEREMDEWRKSECVAEELMDRRLGVRVFPAHIAQHSIWVLCVCALPVLVKKGR